MVKFLMRLIRIILTLCISLFIVQPVWAAEGDIIAGASINVNAKTWWVNCKSLEVKDNCIESVDILDDATQQWTPAVEEKSPYWKPGIDLPLRENAPGKLKCGSGNASYADYCYWFKGAAVDGTDQLLTATVGSLEEVPGYPRISLSLQAQNGFVPKKSKIPANDNKWVTLKPGTTFRITVISDTGAQKAGIGLARMKNPSLEVKKGLDGKYRLIASGNVQEVNEYKWFDNTKQSPCNASGGNELIANYYNVEFAINIEPYYREYAVLQGTPPGGIFISQNGGCESRVTVDPTTKMIQVVSTGTHFDVFGDLITGWVEASIRGDMIRKVFKLEPKSMSEAIIEVTSSDGTPQTATYSTRYIPATDTVEIRGYGYHFSSITIRIKLQQPPAIAPKTQSQISIAVVAPVKASAKPVTISCVKGKVTKKISGTTPKCPAGYKNK
jgi:hypothetical protein